MDWIELDIDVLDGVYPPSEDTYLMLQAIEVSPGERVLEVGCGSGFLALHCAASGGIVMAVDSDRRAVECTRANAERNDLELDVHESDVFEEVEGEFDVIIFNPPYLPSIDRVLGGSMARAWDGGRRGVEVTLRFLEDLPRYMKDDGRCYLCLSSNADPEAIRRAVEAEFRISSTMEESMFFETIYVWTIAR